MTARLSSLLDEVEVLEVIGGDTGRVEVTAVTQDSRSVTEGSLYCCVPGRRVDGHDLAADAVNAGAHSLLVERWVDVAVPQVRVLSSRIAVAPLAAAFYGHPSRRLSVVGVTGTNGKTTTTHLLGAVLMTAGRRTGVLGTLSGERTTPEAALLQARLAEFLEDGCEAVAMEVSSQALDQHRADAVDFAVAVWTNLTQDHLDYHGDLDSYFAAKARLFERGRCALAVVNGDDEWGSVLISRLEVPFTTYGLAQATDLEMGPGGAAFTWRGRRVQLGLAGTHNVLNALGAATAALALGVDEDVIVEGLAAAPPVPGRWERIDEGQEFTVVVDYAHTPDGLRQVLQAARSVATARDGRVVVVFGCGGDRDRSKRPEMARVATELGDVAILTSDNPRNEDPAAILREAAVGAKPGSRLDIEIDRAVAIAQALSAARPGDVVVVSGKGHETSQVIGEEVVPFDDREVVRRHLRTGPAR